jgi:hypothetical protein
VEGASEPCLENDNTGGAEIGCSEYRRVAADCAINEIVFSDMNRRERRRDGSAGEKRLDGRAR